MVYTSSTIMNKKKKCMPSSSSHEEEYKLYDPSLNKTHICKSPELGGWHVRYSRYSWLLMSNFNWTEPFLCAPTSNSCVIFSSCVLFGGSVTIKKYCLDTKVCTSLVFPHQLFLQDGDFEHVVFSNGVFYCLTNTGCLGMFILSTNSWDVLSRRPPKSLRTRRSFLTEYQGDIFLYTSSRTTTSKNPKYLKLDLTNKSGLCKRFSG
ncbi:hypothetical protein EUTSA_v10022459mg [Eutrema salsugineum]|uniref:Uncharacterized protein n=1 Tax=Eutrema salsugineum TaxID=72664 RepID=V4MCB4_EUTSA|nr:hypothetical protein EUTSA_v10022459mg [Eutrema salsugineum]